MPNLKAIRQRIGSVKSTRKITKAMKMVAGARLNRAQARILAIRPYAVNTGRVLREVVESFAEANAGSGEVTPSGTGQPADHPLLAVRSEDRVLYLVITSDRGLCGAFNTNINKRAEREWRERSAAGADVKIATIGRKGRDYFRRRGGPMYHVFSSVWDRLDLEQARAVSHKVLEPFLAGQVDAIYLVYNEFKSAVTQRVVVEPLLPVGRAVAGQGDAAGDGAKDDLHLEYLFEPNKHVLLERLVPMYIEITVLRALLESMASELGAKLTAMDAATKNASEMIDKLTLQYNRARQAAITKEILEIIGGAEALKG